MAIATENTEQQSPLKVKKLDWQGLKTTLHLFSYLKPYRGTFIVGMIFLALSTATSLAFPKLVGSIIEVIEGKSPYTINQITLFLFVILV